MPCEFQTPTIDDHRRFLISFLFNGSTRPGLKESVWRSYLDFNRTADGIGMGDKAKERKEKAHSLLLDMLTTATTRLWDIESYDQWHKAQCTRICAHYDVYDYNDLTVGQAQKWLNMAVKYALCLHGAQMLQIQHPHSLWQVAHAPLDNYVLRLLCSQHKAQGLTCTWSSLTSYEEYFGVQIWLRETFPAYCPLDVEFRLWIKAAAEERGHVA